MADYSMIADVGASLLKLLRENMVPSMVPHPEHIGLASPAERGDVNLGLFLYNIDEAGGHRETGMRSRGPNAQQFPPLAVNLRYLLTAYSNADPQSRAVEEGRLLGRAMQVFYDNSVLRSAYLEGSLAEGAEEPKIFLETITSRAMSDIWTFRDVPYKLSVGYLVGPVELESTRVRTTKRVKEREIILHHE